MNNNLLTYYPNQYRSIKNHSSDLFIADYTNSSDNQEGVNITEIQPTNIDFFHLMNPNKLNISSITFDNSSFTDTDGKPLTQCECVVFPTTFEENSWIIFCELKYNSTNKKNTRDTKKAKRQLIATHDYYFNNNIITANNTSYCFISLPKQRVPFKHFIFDPRERTNLKVEKNIIIKFRNSVSINNYTTINI